MSIIGKTFLNIEDSHLRVVSGNVYAQAINISGINLDAAHGLQSVTNTGNQTFNTLQFSNAITGFVTTANAQIGRDLVVSGNTTVSTDLTVSANATVADTLTISEHLIASKEATVTGNLHVTTIRSDSNVVTEYTGPHDRPLRKYPEVALTADAETASGYKGYKVSSSFEHASHPDWGAFDGVTDATTGWHTGEGSDAIKYTGTDGEYNGTNATQLSSSSNTVNGEYLQIELPKAIKLKYYILYPQGTSGDGQDNSPKRAVLYGSNDGSAWTEVHRYTDAIYDSHGRAGIGYTFHVNSNQSYNYFAIVPTHRDNTAGTPPNTSGVSIGELEFYGHEEGSGSLDTTLKTVYNVPATTGTQLEVYYDAKDLTAMPATVTDLSPNSNGGSVTGATLDTTGGIESFKFIASSSQYIEKVFSGYTHSAEYSASVWFKSDSYTSDSFIFQLGLGDHNDGSGFGMNIESEGPLRAYIYGYGSSSQVSTSVDSIATGTWYHATATYYSSGKIELYVNGVLVGEGKATQLGTINASAPLTLGTYYSGSTRQTPSFNGSIANFRIYNKVLNADQVKELYEYQKDYFLGSKSQVTLYKGHLGVGVTEPSGQLELAGDERLQEYPPRGLVGDLHVFDPDGNAYDYNVEGHGVFKLLSSNRYHVLVASLIGQPPAPPDDRRIYEFFDKDVTVTETQWSSFNSNPPYEATTGAWVTTLDGGSTITAHIAEIQMPYKITLKRYTLTSGSQVPRALKTAMIVGSNDGNVYHVLHNVSDFGFTAVSQTKEYTVDNATTPYRIFRLLLMNTNGDTTCNMRQWRLFGTPGPTTLDKGSLTLGRSLDVPRISRYDVDTETPRPEKLVVDFDTTVNSSPTDISGKGNHGAFYSSAYYSAVDKAFKTTNGGGNVRGSHGLSGTQPVHSHSVWFKQTTDISDYTWVCAAGTADHQKQSGILISGNSGLPNRITFDNYGGWVTSTVTAELNRWYHVVATFNGGTTFNTTNCRIYVDGVDCTGPSSEVEPANPQPFNLQGAVLALGSTNTGTRGLTGLISNYKLYDVVLEPSEVRKLYNLGRTGRSMVISDTAVGIGKVPEAQLDVRGSISATGTIRSMRPMWSVGFQPGSNYTLPQTEVAMLWTPVNYDYTGNYDSSTGYYTIPITGYYAIGVRALIHVPTEQVRVDAYVKKISGGVTTRVIMGERLAGSEGGRATNENMTCQVHGTVYLQSGDQVYAGYTATIASQGYVLSISTDFNEFHGHLIEEVIS
jgi:hypothetical protein